MRTRSLGLAALAATLLAPAAAACGGGFMIVGLGPDRVTPLTFLGLPLGTVTQGFLSERWQLDPLPKLALALLALLLVALARRTADRGKDPCPGYLPVLRPFFLAFFTLVFPLALLSHALSDDGQVEIFVFTHADLGFVGTTLFFSTIATLLLALPVALARLWTRWRGAEGRVARGLAWLGRRPYPLPLVILTLVALLVFAPASGSGAGSWLTG